MRKIGLIGFIIFLWLKTVAQLPSPAIHPMYRADDYPFFHGVAAGDSRSTSFIIWTKLSPKTQIDSIRVQYFISLSPNKSHIVKQGVVFARSIDDYTVKIKVSGLKPFTLYHYWFRVCALPDLLHKGGECKDSPVGHVRTTPSKCKEASSLTFAVFTGSNYNAGYFNAYCAAASDTSIDFGIHTGDYIYEYKNNVYGKNKERSLLPVHELLTFNDYNTRYWLYRMDTCLKKAHQAFGWYAIPDDHEVANDSWKNGAQNHQADEGDYRVRRQNAFRAYYRWMPLEANQDTDFYRVIDMGHLARIILLDTRHHGRDYQGINIWDSTKTMLGQDQLQWFFSQLLKAQHDSVQWIIVVQQLLFAPLIFFNRTLNTDGWDIYPLEREKILRFLYNHSIKNAIFLGGDFHTSWANELYLNAYKFRSRRRDTMVTMEFVTPAITSHAGTPWNTAIMRIITKVIRGKRYIRYVDLHHKGFMKVTVYPRRLVVQWIFVPTIKHPDRRARVFKTFVYQLPEQQKRPRVLP